MTNLNATDIGKIKSYLLGYYKTEGNNYKSGISERQLM
jgi:hypothetical protein